MKKLACLISRKETSLKICEIVKKHKCSHDGQTKDLVFFLLLITTALLIARFGIRCTFNNSGEFGSNKNSTRRWFKSRKLHSKNFSYFKDRYSHMVSYNIFVCSTKSSLKAETPYSYSSENFCKEVPNKSTHQHSSQ